MLTANDIEDMRETLKGIGKKSERYYDACTQEQIVRDFDEATFQPVLKKKGRGKREVQSEDSAY